MTIGIIGGVAPSEKDAKGNRIYIDNENLHYNTINYIDPIIGVRSDVLGGLASEDGTASDNIVTINTGNYSNIIGGYGNNAISNQVIINGGTIYNRIIGGGRGKQTNGNIVSISGGTIKGNVFGGFVGYTSDDIDNSTQKFFVTDNIINIYGNPDLSSTYIYGYSPYDVIHSGNTLNIATKNLTALNIENFDAINFFLPKNTIHGDTVLKLTRMTVTDLSGTAIRAAMQGGSSLDTGDKVTLINSAGTITTNSATTYGKMSQAEYDAIKDRLPSGMLSDGVSLDYEMDIKKSDDGKSIVLTVGNTITDDSGTDPEPVTPTTPDTPDSSTKDASASNHTITITRNSYTIDNDTTTYSGETDLAYGGYADSGNDLGTSEPSDKSIVGGQTANSENSSNNTITINSGTITDRVFGGFSYDKVVSNNKITVNGGTINAIRGGDTYTGSVRNNTVTVNGGTINEICGGIANFAGSSGVTIANNKIIFDGGTITGNVYAGTSYLGKVLNNSIDIRNTRGNLNLSSANLYGYSGSGGEHSGNTLNVYAKDITANNIYNFDTLNFYIPASAKNGDTMLTLTDSNGTDISGAKVNAGVRGGSTLDTGDTVTLLTNPNGLKTTGTTYGTLSEGVSLNYDVNVEKTDDNNIVLTVGNTTDEPSEPSTDPDPTPTTPTTPTNNNSSNNNNSNNTNSNNTSSNDSSNNTGSNDSNLDNGVINGSNGGSGSSGSSSSELLPQTELLAQSQIASLKLVDFMSDKLVDWLPPSSFDFDDDDEDIPDVPQKDLTGYEVFISSGGGSFRNKTGNGSYIKSTHKGFDAGFARSLDYSDGRLVFAPIFEYATGDYDSYLSDNMHSKGNTKYIVGGLIGRKNFNSGFYVEASARGGRTERDFTSYDMKQGNNPVFVHYDKTSAPVFAGHLRIGQQHRLNKNNILDVYGIYFHAHQGSMNLNLSTGENYHFASATSSRARLGYRLTTRTSRISRIYTGLAFQYEHNPNVVGHYKGRRTPSSGSCGSSGMLELGWQIKPNRDNPWMLDLNATGWVGHQKGVSGTLKLQKEF